jgi:hypothetical protein
MTVKFKGRKEGQKISIIMVLPMEQEKTVITFEVPDNEDWRADMECYDKILSAYEERWAKTMGAKEGQ